MKTRYIRFFSFLCCLMVALLQVSVVEAEEESAQAERITLTVSIVENPEHDYLLGPLTLSVIDGTTAEGLLELLQNYAYLLDYRFAEGMLVELSIPAEGSDPPQTYTGENAWSLWFNGARMDPGNIPLLQQDDEVEWVYQPPPSADASSEGEEPLPEVASVSTASLWTNEASEALTKACAWLRTASEEPSALISLGAAGVSVDYRNISALKKKIFSSKTYSSPVEVATDILAATFCGIYAGNVSGVDLLQTLGNYPDISRSGSVGASLALLAADSNAYHLPSDGINTRSTLLSIILSAQNDDGGFGSSHQAGDSSPYLTALALTALSRYQQNEEIREALTEGFTYLSAIQASDGGFTSSEASAAQTTGAVLSAICAAGSAGYSPDGSLFVKDANPLDALLSFRAESGGFFAERSGGEPDIRATEQAILALVSLKSSRSGYTLRTLINESVIRPSEDVESSIEPSESAISSAPADEPISSQNILYGGVGLSIGFALGAILLITMLIMTRRKYLRKNGKKDP